MLAPADAAVAARDPTLPGLPLLLNPEAVADLLRQSVLSFGVLSVRPLYVRYKPGTRCLVAYEVRTPNGTLPVHANAYSTLRAMDAAAASIHRAQDVVTPGRIVAAPGIVISVFPHDDTLPSLARVWHRDDRNGLLEKLLPECPALWDAEFKLLAYKPGRRCVAVLRGAGGAAAVLKAYTASGFSRAMVGGRAFFSRGAVRVASILGRSRRHHLIAFEWLPGETLSTLLHDERVGTDRLEEVGAALASLHLQKARRLRADRNASVGVELSAVATGIGSLCPEIGDRAVRLAQVLATSLQQVEDGVPLHGDFHAGQVVAAGESIAIIDMDRASRGDSRADVASFIAHLRCEALDGRIDANIAERAGDALLEGYERSSHRPVRHGLEPYVAAALLRLAPRPFRSRLPDWPLLTAEIVRRAEALVGMAETQRGHGFPRPSVVDPFDVLADRALSLAPAALDPEAMGARLADLKGARKESVTVHAIRVSRHKAGRRCLLEYDVSFAGRACRDEISTFVGKVRAKGVDRRTYHLSRRLWSDGFGDDSPDGISVAQPIGVLPDLKMWLQVRVPGVSLTTLLTQDLAAGLGERVARAIRKLHCHSAEEAPLHTIEDELRLLHERLLRTAACHASYHQRLDTVFERCTRLALMLPRVEPRGIHRDFHPDQVLVHGDAVYLLDLDLYAAGDPALDVGNFLGHITEYSLRLFGDGRRLATFEAAMKRCYLNLDSTVSEDAIEIYKTLTLARLIHISTIIPERRPVTERLIEVVRSRLDQNGQGNWLVPLGLSKPNVLRSR
jgi:Ser/Thr protein kinase RdoA (MazF antagonist)